MKIAVNARFLLPRLEGIGHYTLQMIDHLSKIHPDDEFHIILDRKYHHLINRDNIVSHVLYPSARHPVLWYYWFEISLPSLLKEIKPDAFFSPDGYLSLKSETPTVMAIHDLAYLHYPEGSQWSHLLFLRKFMPKYLDRADTITCVSQFTADDVIAHFPSIENKIKVVRNGVTSDFKPVAESEALAWRNKMTSGRPYFLYLGAIHPRKNVARLIGAFEQYKRARQDNTCLVLAGRMAWDASDVRAAIDNSSFRNDIVHLNYIDDAIPLLVGAAKAMCYPSLFEGFGLPVLEAMACGVPVITSMGSAMQEVCGSAAIYVDPEDDNAIKAAMMNISEDTTLHQSLAKSGIDRAALFSWQKSAEHLYEAMKEIFI